MPCISQWLRREELSMKLLRIKGISWPDFVTLHTWFLWTRWNCSTLLKGITRFLKRLKSLISLHLGCENRPCHPVKSCGGNVMWESRWRWGFRKAGREDILRGKSKPPRRRAFPKNAKLLGAIFAMHCSICPLLNSLESSNQRWWGSVTFLALTAHTGYLLETSFITKIFWREFGIKKLAKNSEK